VLAWMQREQLLDPLGPVARWHMRRGRDVYDESARARKSLIVSSGPPLLLCG
jgi:hypothetical protein